MKKLILTLICLFMCFACAEDTLLCDTAFHGCKGLPITWTAETEKAVAGFDVYLSGETTPVFSDRSGERVIRYVPRTAGQYFAICTLENGETLLSEEVSAAEKLYMGVYEQDGDPEAEELIEWTVLSVEDDKALLISKYILHNNSYFNPWWIKYKYTYWAKSYIGDFPTNYWGSQPEDPSRRYDIYGPEGILMEDKTRGTEEDLYMSELHCRYWCNYIFYEQAFSEEDKTRILLTHNTNPDNPESHVAGGPDTDDHVFFLSYEELNRYMPTAESRKCTQTEAAKREGKNNQGSYWWLRTPGQFRVNAMYVYGSNGHITTYGSDVGHDMVGYRPCVWIQIGG